MQLELLIPVGAALVVDGDHAIEGRPEHGRPPALGVAKA